MISYYYLSHIFSSAAPSESESGSEEDSADRVYRDSKPCSKSKSEAESESESESESEPESDPEPKSESEPESEPKSVKSSSVSEEDIKDLAE